MKTKYGVQQVLIFTKCSRDVVNTLCTLPSGPGSCVVFKDVEECYPKVVVAAMIFDADWEAFQEFEFDYYIKA